MICLVLFSFSGLISIIQTADSGVDRAYLDPSSNNNSHEEVWDNTGYGHHQAFNNSNTSVQAQHKEQIMDKSRMKVNHEVAYGPRNKGNEDQIWHCRNRVADDECHHPIVAIHPFSLKNLHELSTKIAQYA